MLFSWFLQLFRRKARADDTTVPPPRRAGFRPGVEGLEDRRVFSVRVNVGAPGVFVSVLTGPTSVHVNAPFVNVDVSGSGRGGTPNRPACLAPGGTVRQVVGPVRLRGRLRTGVMADGGEATGVVVRTRNGVFELELRGGQCGAAGALDGRRVEVRGTLVIREGVETPERAVVQVVRLRPV
jgi:hypothetical protein